MTLSSLAHAPAVDCRPLDLRLREALIWADIETERLKLEQQEEERKEGESNA